MAQRIKGQEVRLTFTGPTGKEEGISAVQSFEFEYQREVLSEGYLGETRERKDDIIHGVRGRVEMHLEKAEFFLFVERVNARSERRGVSGKFNAVGSFAFPGGRRRRVVFKDIMFGSIPVNTGSRNEYVQVSIDFECSQARFLP